MAKKHATQRRPVRAFFSWLVTLLAGAGVGGWAYPELPVVGKAVQAGLHWAGFDGQVVADRLTADGAVAGVPAAGVQRVGATTRLAQAVRPPSVQPGETISIATFNIQVFGTSKLQNTVVMQRLVHIMRQLDLVAIQEVRSTDDGVIPSFVQMINSNGSRYHYVIGPRLGRTSSKEQYAFVYNTDRMEVDPNSVLSMDDPSDLLHREPLLARFRARTIDPARGFTFWLMNVHTDPDEVKSEVDALADAFASVQQQGWGEDDVILLGDLNASETQLGRLGQLPGMRCAIARSPTNTRGDKTYDNILLDGRMTIEFTGQAGVINMMQMFGISQEEALKISDHQPVWATFSCYENSPVATVAQQAGSRR